MWRWLAQLLLDRRMMPAFSMSSNSRQRQPESLQVMLDIMLGCRKLPFVLSYILELSKEASVLR